MAKRPITVFYAWQSDCDLDENKKFIRIALDEAANRINAEGSLDVEVKIDADTEGVVGTPPVTETILKKIRAADIFAPDLTFVAEAAKGKLVPNPNVMLEYGYALNELTFEAMMPIMNTYYGEPNELPFDLSHVRHPTQYCLEPNSKDSERRAARAKFSEKLEGIMRLMIQNILSKARTDNFFQPVEPVRPPAFFFQPDQVLVNFGHPGEQEMRFKRDKAVYLRLFPTYADQPRVGLARAVEVAQKLLPMQSRIDCLHNRNDLGAISVVPHGDGITSFTQIFATGELWGVSEEAFRFEGMPFIAPIGVEKALAATLENYRLVYEKVLGLRPPFTVEFGAVGIMDHYLRIPSVQFLGGQFAGPIRMQTITRRFQLDGFAAADWQSALRDFMIEFYDLAACDRSQVLTDDLVNANDIPPR